MANWRGAWLAGLIFGLVGSGGVAHAQTGIRVTNLLGEGAITDPLPVQVELRQRGASTRGVLEWWSEPGLRYRLPVELPAGARKVVYLALPLNAWHLARGGNGGEFRVPTLLWRSEAGDWRLLEVPFAWNNRLPVVVIGDVQGGFELWRRATFALEYRFSSQEVRSSDWTLEPIYWSPASVPPEWRVLLGIPVIVLVEGSERLLADQWDALLAWLLAGGHLIVSVGSIGTPLKGTPLAPLLPPLGERVVVELRQGELPAETPAQGIFGSAESRPSAPPSRGVGEGQGVQATSQVVLIRSPGWDDAIARVRHGGALVACSRRVGRGTLTLVFSEMTARSWRTWQGYEPLIHQWAAMLDLPLFGIRTPFEPRAMRPTVSQSQVLGATLVFALYWLALYLSWRVLRRHRLLIRAPVVLLVLTGLTWLALVRIVPGTVHQVQSHQARILLADRHLPIALEHSSYHLLLPAGEHRLRWEPDVRLLAARRQVLLSDRLIVEYGTHTEALFQPFGASEVQLQLVRLLKWPAPIRVSHSKGRYTVRNPLPYPLYQVQIRRARAKGVPPGVFDLVRGLASGATVSAEPRWVSGMPALLPREGEWLAAMLIDTPSPLKTPLDGREEPTTLWVRIR